MNLSLMNLMIALVHNEMRYQPRLPIHIGYDDVAQCRYNAGFGGFELV